MLEQADIISMQKTRPLGIQKTFSSLSWSISAEIHKLMLNMVQNMIKHQHAEANYENIENVQHLQTEC